MKSKKIELLSWTQSPDFNDTDIDWPKLHKMIGLDRTKWILEQDYSDCQMVLERKQSEMTVVAEFFNERTELEYHLRWG